MPPPPATRDDSPESFDVPRMEPPPASLEAMVRSKPGSPLPSERSGPWLWIAGLALLIAAAAYYLGLRR